MEASIEEGYGNGNHFTEKMMETEINSEMAFAVEEPMKDCPETYHTNTDMQVTDYPVESTENQMDVFIAEDNSVQNLTDSVDNNSAIIQGVPDNDNQQFEVKETMDEQSEMFSVQNDVYVSKVDNDEETHHDDELANNFEAAYMATEQTTGGNNDDDDVNIPAGPSEESIDTKINMSSEMQEGFVIGDDHKEEIEQVEEEVDTTPQYIVTSDNAFLSQYEIESSQQVQQEEQETVSNHVVEEVVQETTKQEPISAAENSFEEQSEANKSIDEVPSLQLSETSTEHVLIEEETIQAEETTIPSFIEVVEGDMVMEMKMKKTEVMEDDSTTCTTEEITYSLIEEGPQVVEISSDNIIPETTDRDEEQEKYSGNVIEDMQTYQQNETKDTAEIATDPSEPTTTMNKEKQQNEQESKKDVAKPAKKERRCRKPICEIPMHVLGHNIANPMENVPNGKAVPKPRLGVKVPYRNLTSQMVSKAEIEQEIMERSRQKQAMESELSFSRSLTKRLAKKIAPSNDDENDEEDDVHEDQIVKTKKEESKPLKKSTPAVTRSNPVAIENDSDLLAILEGDGADEMPVLTQEQSPSKVDESNMKQLEREIALQQLQDLPHQAPKQRVFRTRQSKTAAAEPTEIDLPPAPPKTVPNSAAKQTVASNLRSSSVNDVSSSSSSSSKPPPPPSSSGKENSSSTAVPIKKEITNSINLPTTTKKEPIEIEPQVKVNMVLKTYSRKRNIADIASPASGSPSPKKPQILDDVDHPSHAKHQPSPAAEPMPSDVYVTKSSRVIKKKVIWDPDEVPSTRSPKTAIRSSSTDSSATTPSKLVKTIDKNANTEKVDKKSVTVVSKPSEKKIATPNNADKVIKKKLSPKVAATKTPVKSKKALTEVERLLMDEGAVKMLYDLKNNEEPAVPKKKKDFFSVERAQKEIIKKANQLKNELEQNTGSTKSLRKKDGPSPPKQQQQQQAAAATERKMSKDSIRSSVHTPPGSPYPHAQGTSMLIRRRSSSSISSSDELDSDAARPVRRKSDTPRGGGGGAAKRLKKSTAASSEGGGDGISSAAVLVVEVEASMTAASRIESSNNEKTGATTTSSSSTNISVKKCNKQVSIDFNDAGNQFLTLEILDELTAALNKFGKDKDVNVLSITSSNEVFSLGLDYTYLVCDDEVERKERAKNLAESVKDFLLCLLHFPKVLVAGIQGDCSGLALTMLPLFDFVIASDAAHFNTPYAQLGCMSEAGFLLNPPYLSSNGLATELLFMGQTLTADEAFRRGLVSKLCWPEKYKNTLKSLLASIAKGSKQSLLATKTQLRNKNIKKNIEDALNAEFDILVAHWTSAECQNNFNIAD